jgi:hypothetical protein
MDMSSAFEYEEEVLRELTHNRRRFRALAQACCPKDRRILGAVYPMIGGYWLWHLDERMTFEQAKREALAMAAIEYDTAIESGMDSQEAWDLVLPDSDDVDRIRHLPQGEGVTYLIHYGAMAYAARWAVHTHSAKPVIVHPGRRMEVGWDYSGPAFGFDHPWRPTPWTIIGLDTPESADS